jgi:hypothetical protein
VEEAYALKMPVLGTKALYKVASAQTEGRGWWAHLKTAAMEEPAAGQPDTEPVTRPPPI